MTADRRRGTQRPGATTTTATTTTTTQRDGQLNLRAQEIDIESESSAAESSSRPQVRWTDDVVDNEHMNKKKTKICCIYHRPKEFGESSSSDDDSSSDSDSDSGHHKNCNHDHDESGKPNAYERQPKNTGKN